MSRGDLARYLSKHTEPSRAGWLSIATPDDHPKSTAYILTPFAYSSVWE
jgi:hypothetical protein